MPGIPHSRRGGFTLIELLVVIAVIAILAAILFPVFSQARDKARQTACLSNMKQVGAAIYLYAQDFDEMYPHADYTLPAGAPSPLNPQANGFFALRVNHYKWEAWMLPYVRNTQLFFCPSRPRDDEAWAVNGEIKNGYALHLAITGASNRLVDRPGFLGGSLAGPQTPAETFILMELWNQVTYSYILPNSTLYPAAHRESWLAYLRPNGITDRKSASHAEGFSLAFCDGHAKWVPVSGFLSRCPTRDEYTAPRVIFSTNPGAGTGVNVFPAPGPPGWSRPWPLWGLY